MNEDDTKEEKDQFWKQLQEELDERGENRIIMGDISRRVGEVKSTQEWKGGWN